MQLTAKPLGPYPPLHSFNIIFIARYQREELIIENCILKDLGGGGFN